MTIYEENRWPDGEPVWTPSVPEPFWFATSLVGRLLRREPRMKPGCYSCSLAQGEPLTFADRGSWEDHWLARHYECER